MSDDQIDPADTVVKLATLARDPEVINGLSPKQLESLAEMGEMLAVWLPEVSANVIAALMAGAQLQASCATYGPADILASIMGQDQPRTSSPVAVLAIAQLAVKVLEGTAPLPREA